MIKREFIDGCRQLYAVCLEYIKKTKFIRYMILGILLLSLVGGIVVAYRTYMSGRECSAQYDLGNLIIEYQKAKRDEKGELQSVIDTGNQMYQRHNGTYLAPYFLLLQVRALSDNKQWKQARELAESTLPLMESSPLYPFITMQYALMLLDSDEDAMHQKGLEHLLALARDVNNIYNDAALFLVGRYYWIKNDSEEAKMIWQELVDSYQFDTTAPSAWAERAQAMLQQIP